MAVKAQYTGLQICKECHEEIFAVKDQYLNRNIACEACHGPALAHSEAPDEQDLVVPMEWGLMYESASASGFELRLAIPKTKSFIKF